MNGELFSYYPKTEGRTCDLQRCECNHNVQIIKKKIIRRVATMAEWRKSKRNP